MVFFDLAKVILVINIPISDDILFLIYEPSVKQATGKRSFNFANKELAFKARMDPFSD